MPIHEKCRSLPSQAVVLRIFEQMSYGYLSQDTFMISAGTDKYIWIDFGKDEPGMTLQRFDGRVWGDLHRPRQG